MGNELDGYRDSVLDAARRAGNVPPADLLVRYDVDPRRIRTEEEFTQRVKTVVKYWRSLKLQRKYLALATALLTANTGLERDKKLTLAAFLDQREQSRGQAAQRLDQLVETLASAPCVSSAGVRRLVDTLDGAFGEVEIRAALEARSVLVVEPWNVPVRPPAKAARSLRAPLTALGMRLSPEVLFGSAAVRAGFSLRERFRLADGRTLTTAALRQAQEDQTVTKQDERKTAVDTVLTILVDAAGRDDTLHRLLLWEVCEHLRPDVAAGLPTRLVAHAATTLGLDADEAAELAATLAGEGDSGGGAVAAQQITEALQAGRLHEARDLLGDLPSGEAGDQRVRVDAAWKEVDELVRAADGVQAEGRTEEAAGLLADAAARALDDVDIPARLARIPPPPPTGTAAAVDGERVVVRWTPGPARTGGVRFRVVRTTGTPATSSTGGAAIAGTTANEAVDPKPPVAESVFYTVFADRGGDTWSTGSASAAVEVLPEVADLALDVTAESVHGTWRAHPEAMGAVVTRTTPADPTARHTVSTAEPDSSSFVDDSVLTDHAYDYAVTAVYRSRNGRRRTSEPVVLRATPAAPPGVVEDLAVELAHDGAAALLRLTWRQPRGGTVEIRRSQTAPQQPVGTTLGRGEAAALGLHVGGTVETDDAGRATVYLPARQGHTVLTAVTVAGDRALIGGSVELDLVDPVTGLTATRVGDTVRLAWVWPPGADLARVEWGPDTPGRAFAPAGELLVPRRVYVDMRGAECDVGPGPVVVTVHTVSGSGPGATHSPAASVRVAGRPARVVYRPRTSGLLGLRRAHLTLVGERTCRLPPLVVVYRDDGIPPLSPDRGLTVAEVQECDLAAGQALVLPLRGRIRTAMGVACFVAPGSSPPDEIVLVAAPPEVAPWPRR